MVKTFGAKLRIYFLYVSVYVAYKNKRDNDLRR